MRKKKKQVKGAVKVKKATGVVYLGRRSTISVIFTLVATIMILFGVTAAGIPIVPMVWYRLAPNTSFALENILRKPVTSFEDSLVASGEKTIYQPEQDLSLPLENRLIIEKIGLDTEILEEPVERHEEAFRKGVWRVPDFGTAYNRELPMILAAHRFGYLAWTNQYRRQNSFFNLPDLVPGDRVEVIWDQRRYVYEIYDGEEGTEISQYTADLILYTCRFIESDVRIFRYARLVQ
jgi:sortase (surface protein transpeptidase)